MANYVVSDSNLTAIANAIRTKGGTSAQLEFPDDFIAAIGDIPSGGGGLSGVDGGTYTAASETDTFSVPVTALHSNIVFIPTKTLANMNKASATLTFVMGWANSAQYQYVFNVRSSNTNDKWIGVNDNDWRGQIAFTASTISGSFYGQGAKAYFPAGETYQWFAW